MSENAIQTATGLYRYDKAAFHVEKLRAMQEGRQPYPVHVQIILSDLCNQDCSFCAYRVEGYSSNQLFNDPNAPVPRNPNRMLPTGKVMGLLDDCQAMGVRAIQLTGGGEPTVHPEFDQIVKGILDRGINFALVTNGTLLDRTSPWLMEQRDVRVSLLAKAAWVRVSLDAATAKQYSLIRRVPEQMYKHALRNIQLLAEEIRRQKSACRLGVGFVVTKDNYHEVAAAIDLVESLGVDNIRISAAFMPAGARYHADYAADVRRVLAEVKTVARRPDFTVYDNFGDRMEDLEGQHPDYSRCPIMQLQTYVAGDGNVYTCCINAYNLRGKIGSFLEQGFKVLWDSQRKGAFFDAFDAKGCPACMYNPKNRFMNALISSGVVPEPSEAPPEHVDFI